MSLVHALASGATTIYGLQRYGDVATHCGPTNCGLREQFSVRPVRFCAYSSS